jgi:decaprenylphospho-beta-D-erythro-pentofuranosid-2-ulose 2-reductase
MTAKQKTALIVGGSSDIGRAIAGVYAENGWSLILAARDGDACRRAARDLAVRYEVEAVCTDLDIRDVAAFETFADGFPLPDTVVSVVGMLGEQVRAEVDMVHAAEVLLVNFNGPALLLGLFGDRMAKRGHGTIVGVSSVAGDRGRASNYVYGSAKSGFSAFLSGLRGRLARCSVHVLTVKPGFVRTKMTEGIPLPGLLTTDPSRVAASVFAAAETKRRDVVYLLPIWRWIMMLIAMMPERVFKRLRF